MEIEAKQLIKRLESLKTIRARHESVWRDCFDYTYPLRGSGFNGDNLDAVQGANKNARNLDSTATDAVRILASAKISGETPANSIWFDLHIGEEEEDDDAKRYLSDAAEIIWSNIHASNFDSVAYECQLDSVISGWFAMYVTEDHINGGYAFEGWPIAQVYCASTNPRGSVDTVYRDYTLTAIQALNEFKAENVSDSILEAVNKNEHDREFKFLHAIFPREKANGGKLARNLPIASYHVEIEGNMICRESGYHEMPVIVPRWMLIPSTCYAVGQVYDALADIRELNDLKSLDKSAAEISIAGMWIAEDDGVLNPRSIKVGARKIIVANSVNSMKELKSSGNWQLADMRIQQLQASIRKIMMVDNLMPPDGPVITATQSHINADLLRQQQGPMYGREKAEYLQPLIERCFGIAYRAGVLGAPPESLVGREFDIKYLSPLARAQKFEEVTAIERFNANIGQIAQVNQGVLDNIDFDEQARILGDSLGVPNDILRKPEDVAALRQKRIEDMEAQQSQAQMQQFMSQAGQSVVENAGRAIATNATRG